jgi:hypothetical protein
MSINRKYNLPETTKASGLWIWYLIITFIAVSMSSCFREKPIKAPVYNNTDTYLAAMGENYTTQLYFNIQAGQFVDSNSRYIYDMAFDCNASGFNVWLNGANLMKVCHTGKYDMSQTSWSDTMGHSWQLELGSGIPANNAIGVWNNGALSNREVLLLDLGIDSNGNSLGFKKVQMQDMSTTNFTDDTYNVTFSNVDGSDMHSAAVTKVFNKNKVFLSFSNGGVVHDLEPDNTFWDLLFTDYTIYFSSFHLPYKVTGVLTNPNKTYAYFVDSTSSFYSITKNTVQQGSLTAYPLDNIGYTWKRFNGIGYTVDTSYNYIIKSDSRYYRLRFLSFSDPSGTASKGYPKFQCDELK